MGEGTLLIGMLAVYTAVMLQHARSGATRSRGTTEFVVAGRSMGAVAIAVSFFATYSSTNTFLGFSGKAYSWGPGWLLLVPFAVGMSVLSWLLVAPRLRRFTGLLESLTIPDFIGTRFASQRARVVAAVIIVLASVLYMTAIFKGMGNLLEELLGVPYAVAIGVVVILVMAYTVVGGFHAVVRTDVVQGSMMVIAAMILAVGVIGSVGGPGAAFQILTSPVEGTSPPPFGLLLGVLFATTVKFVVEPRQLSRFYALDDPRSARQGLWISAALIAITFMCLTPIGLLLRSSLGDGIQDSDRIVPMLLAGREVFGPMATAFLFVAVIAAAMSSLDSVLLVVATTAERDLWSVGRPALEDGRSLSRIRWLIVGFSLLTALVALRPPGDIVALTSFSGALYGACFLPPVLLGLWWRGGSESGVLGAFLGGGAVMALWPLSPFGQEIHPVFPAIGASLVAYCGLSGFNSLEARRRAEALFGEAGV